MRKCLLITSFIFFICPLVFGQHSAFQMHMGRPTPPPVQNEPNRPPAMPSAEIIGGQSFQNQEASDGLEDGGAPSQQQGSNFFVYDPYLDNHLMAPSEPLDNSLFGYKVSDVENFLRGNGARNNSYAFGKYSRMVLSKYLIEISFDKDKRVGAFKVSPMQPYKVLPPKAREYFMQTIMGDAEVSQFKISIGSNELEIKYQGR